MKIIINTAFISEETRTLAKQVGADAFCIKPIMLSQIYLIFKEFFWVYSNWHPYYYLVYINFTYNLNIYNVIKNMLMLCMLKSYYVPWKNQIY